MSGRGQILQGEEMSDNHRCNCLYSAKSLPKNIAAMAVLLACWLLLQAGMVWSQQSKREYIYLDGKLVSVETGAVTPLAVNITAPTPNPTYNTNSSPVTLGGTLANNVGTTRINWANSRGGSGTCSGTTSWTCSGIAMQMGRM